MKTVVFSLCFLFTGYIFAQENCADGIDNDGDALIDLNDPDCACAGFTVSGSGSNLITNPSFEDVLCCPTGFGQLTCADLWLQATTSAGGFSDYWHTCGVSTSTILTDAATPAPDGDGWAGFISGWESGATHNEYVSKCLGSTLFGGTTYTLTGWLAKGDGNADLNLTIYGTPSCADLPWTTNTCPDGIGGWQEIGATVVNMPTYGDWYPFTLIFTPAVDINAIAIGGNCVTMPVPGTDTYNYYYIDDLDLNDGGGGGGFTGGSITETITGCDVSDLTASVGATGGELQWYFEGVALVGETAPTLDVTGTGAGDYQAVYFMPNSTTPDSCHQFDHTVVPGGVVANFGWMDTCYTDPTSFTDLSTFGTGTITSWLWDMGDGGAFSFLQDPAHTFSGPGTFNVTLTITHSSGCDDVISQTVEITDCYANLTEGDLGKLVRLFPNPSNGSFSIEFEEVYEKVSVEIQNVLGEVVLNETFPYLSKISDLSLKEAGVYFVTVMINDEVSGTLRLINE